MSPSTAATVTRIFSLHRFPPVVKSDSGYLMLRTGPDTVYLDPNCSCSGMLPHPITFCPSADRSRTTSSVKRRIRCNEFTCSTVRPDCSLLVFRANVHLATRSGSFIKPARWRSLSFVVDTSLGVVVPYTAALLARVAMAEGTSTMGSVENQEESDVFVTPPPKRPCTNEAASASVAQTTSDVVVTPPNIAVGMFENSVHIDESVHVSGGDAPVVSRAAHHAARMQFLALKNALTQTDGSIGTVQQHALQAVGDLMDKRCCSYHCLRNVDINLQYQRYVHLFAMDRESRNRVLYIELMSFAAKNARGEYSYNRNTAPVGYKYRYGYFNVICSIG